MDSQTNVLHFEECPSAIYSQASCFSSTLCHCSFEKLTIPYHPMEKETNSDDHEYVRLWLLPICYGIEVRGLRETSEGLGVLLEDLEVVCILSQTPTLLSILAANYRTRTNRRYLCSDSRNS